MWGAGTPPFHLESLFWVTLTISLKEPFKIFFKWAWIFGGLDRFPEIVTRNKSISGISHDVDTLKWKKKKKEIKIGRLILTALKFLQVKKNSKKKSKKKKKNSILIKVLSFNLILFHSLT